MRAGRISATTAMLLAPSMANADDWSSIAWPFVLAIVYLAVFGLVVFFCILFALRAKSWRPMAALPCWLLFTIALALLVIWLGSVVEFSSLAAGVALLSAPPIAAAASIVVYRYLLFWSARRRA